MSGRAPASKQLSAHERFLAVSQVLELQRQQAAGGAARTATSCAARTRRKSLLRWCLKKDSRRGASMNCCARW